MYSKYKMDIINYTENLFVVASGIGSKEVGDDDERPA